jgi:hypothetical protein
MITVSFLPAGGVTGSFGPGHVTALENSSTVFWAAELVAAVVVVDDDGEVDPLVLEELSLLLPHAANVTPDTNTAATTIRSNLTVSPLLAREAVSSHRSHRELTRRRRAGDRAASRLTECVRSARRRAGARRARTRRAR